MIRVYIYIYIYLKKKVENVINHMCGNCGPWWRPFLKRRGDRVLGTWVAKRRKDRVFGAWVEKSFQDEGMASREEGGFGPTFRQRKGRGRTLTDHVKIFEGIFPNKHHGHHMLKRMHAYTHTCKFMCLNHLRVCLVGRLVDWLSDRLL